MEKDSLRRKTLNGVIWKLLERIFAQGVSFVVTIILARILVPEDYSVVSIVTVFFVFCNIIITGGLNTSLIRKKESDIIDYSTVLWFTLLLAISLYLILFFTAPLIARLYDKPILTSVFRVMGIILFVYSAKSVIYAFVAHKMQFRMFFWSTLIGTLISAGFGIFMAMKGFGCWALVVQQLSNNIIDLVILLFVTKIRFKFVFSLERFKYHFSYSWKVFISSIIDTTYNTIKPLIIGIRYSTTDLAYYNKGNNFPTLVNTTVSNTMSSVLFSAFSKLQDDKDALLAAVRRYIKLSSFIMFPAMMGLFFVAEPLVVVLLTEKWLPAVPYLRIFSVVYMFDLIHVGNLHAIKALGRTDITLRMEILKKSFYFITIFLFLFFSNTTLSFAICNIVCSFIGTIINTYPNRKLLGYKYKLQLLDLWKNMLCTLLMCVVLFLLSFLPVSMLVMLFIQIFVGVLTYILFCFLVKNDNLKYSLNLLKHHRK